MFLPVVLLGYLLAPKVLRNACLLVANSVYYWDFRLNDVLIKQEKPDVIIHIFVGRQFAVFNNIQSEQTKKPEV